MNMLMTLVLAVQMLAAVIMIGLVLIQHGKGADMGASFGSGSSGSLFGASGSANFLSRSTSVCAAVFFVCTLALAYFAHSGARQPAAPTGSSVLERASTAPAGSASATGAAQIPGSPPAASAVAPVPEVPASGAAAIPR
jgi:preprotein translocase subunit SecG